MVDLAVLQLPIVSKQKLGNDVEVILVDRQPYFMVGFRKSWALMGESTLEAGQKPIDSLSRIGVDVRRATIELINPQEKSAVVDGEKIQADALVVALGAELNPICRARIYRARVQRV